MISTRENYPKVITKPVVIISFNLAGWAIHDSPSLSAYHALLPWLKGNVALVELDYNFSNFTTIQILKNRLDDLIEELTEGRLAKYVNNHCYQVPALLISSRQIYQVFGVYLHSL